MTTQKVIGIIGAGIAGPTFALQVLTNPILKSLYKPTIYDQRPNIQTPETSKSVVQSAGAAVALSPNGLYPLYQLGLKDVICEASSEMSVLKIWRAEDVPILEDGVHVRNAVGGSHRFFCIERRRLQSLLLDRVKLLGGKIVWNKKLEGIENVESGETRLEFSDKTDVDVTLLVGSDGGWSQVRRHILRARNEATAEKKWLPTFMGATGFYGISSAHGFPEGEDKHAVHGIWLDQGNLSSALLPNGKIRWDLQIPERSPPEMSVDSTSKHQIPESSADWESKIAPGAYDRSSSIEILRRHAGVWHPVTGTFGRLLANSDRIIRSPLRQHAWDIDEIQGRNAVVIGDAARLLLPSSGQGSSFAIEDATILANALLNNPPSPLAGFETALSEYAATRVPRSKQMASAAYWIGTLGLGETWYWRWACDFLSRWMPAGEDLKKSGKETSDWPFNMRQEIKLSDERLDKAVPGNIIS